MSVVGILASIKSSPEIVGSAVVDEARVLARDLPDLFRDHRLVQVGKALTTARAAAQRAKLEVESIDLDFAEARVNAYFLTEQRLLVVVAMAGANRAFLELTVGMAIDELRSQGTESFRAASRPQMTELPPAVLDRLARELAEYVGPAAKVLVQRAHQEWLANGDPDRTRLLNALAAEIDQPDQRREFSQQVAGTV